MGPPSQDLFNAATRGDVQAVDSALERYADVDFRWRGSTPLLRASQTGHAKIVQHLLVAGASVDLAMQDEETPLFKAVRWGQTAVVELLLAAHATIDIVCSESTPLLTASSYGFMLIVGRLLAAGARVNFINRDHETSLYKACESGHVAIVEQLLAAGANVDLATNDKATPLFMASCEGHTAIVECLLAAGASVDLAMLDRVTPLYIAAQRGYASIVDRLLDARANVNFLSDGLTPLYIAACNGHVDVVERLLVAGANVDLTTDGKAAPLTISAVNGHIDVVKKLLAAGANVNVVESNRDSPLIAAARGNHTDIARVLADAGADPHFECSTGKTSADIFEENGNTAAARFLRECEASPVAFFRAIEQGNLDVVRRLATARGVACRGAHGRTPLHIAAQYGHYAVVQLLVECGASLAARDDQGRTPLHLACAKGDLATVAFMMSQGARHSVADDRGMKSIDVAARYGRLNIVRAIVDHGASLTNVAFDGRTILHHAILRQHAALLDYLLRQGVDCLNAQDCRGSTPLHYAVQQLVMEGEDIDGCLLQPPLDWASTIDQLAILNRLLSAKGVDANVQNADGDTPLMVALSSTQPRAAAVGMLITSGVSVSTPNYKGETALLCASERGDAATVRLLLDHGARADVVDAWGRTPLSVAATTDIRSVVQLYHNSHQFHDRCFEILNNSEASPLPSQISELVPLITSVYDLRLMLTLTTMSGIDAATRSLVLKAAFEHTVANKLTFDDHACVLFKLVLEHCEREKLLSREEFLLFDRQAEKANTESAEWVVELKKQVHTNSWRLDNHEQHLKALVDGLMQIHAMVMENRGAIVETSERVESLQYQVREGRKLVAQLISYAQDVTAQINNLDQRLTQSERNITTVATHLSSLHQAYAHHLDEEKRKKQMKMVCGVIASVTGFVLGPALTAISDKIVDFTEPIDVATGCGITDVTKFLLDEGHKHLPGLIRSQLEKYAIPPDAFEDLMREGIALTHPEMVEGVQCGLQFQVLGAPSDFSGTNTAILEVETSAVAEVLMELQTTLNEVTANRTKTPSKHACEGGGNAVHTSALGISCSVDVLSHISTLTLDGAKAIKSKDQDKLTANTRSVEVQSIKAEVPIQHGTDKTSDGGRVAMHTISSLSMPAGVVSFVSGPHSFPYHVAVQQCNGEVATFQELVKNVDKNVDPNATMEMLITETVTTHEKLSAAQYAYVLGYTVVGDAIAARMVHAPKVDRAPAKSVSFEEDLDDFPFVLAVVESKGDVEDCQDFMDTLDDDGHTVDDEIHAVVEREWASQVAWTVYEYACHLGYAEVVKYLLKEVCTGVPAKTRFQVMKQARCYAKALNIH